MWLNVTIYYFTTDYSLVSRQLKLIRVPNNFTLGISSSILRELDFEGCVTKERFCCVRKNNNKQAKTKRESIKQQKSEQIRNNGNYERIIRFD